MDTSVENNVDCDDLKTFETPLSCHDSLIKNTDTNEPRLDNSAVVENKINDSFDKVITSPCLVCSNLTSKKDRSLECSDCKKIIH